MITKGGTKIKYKKYKEPEIHKFTIPHPETGEINEFEIEIKPNMPDNWLKDKEDRIANEWYEKITKRHIQNNK